MRKETQFNLGQKKITPIASPVAGVLKPKVQKPAIDQTAGEIAKALEALIPGAEAYYKAEQTQDIEDAKVTAAGMTVQEAIAFAGKSTDEQAEQLGTRALKAHAAAQAAIGKKIVLSREYEQKSIEELYSYPGTPEQRTDTHARERARMLEGIPKDNPVMYAAAVEQLENYVYKISNRAESVRQGRAEYVAREETYEDSHKQISDGLLAYAGSGNKFAFREILTGLDTTQRENYAGISGINAQHEAGVKDAFIGFSIDHPDEAQAALEEAVAIGFFKQEEASEIQDKILQQVDIKERREARLEDSKYKDVQDLADRLIYDNIKEGVEPGTSVTDYLNSAQGAAVIQSLQSEAKDQGIDINSGRFSSLVRDTASTIFRDAGAGEYSIGEEMEAKIKEIGANQGEFTVLLETSNFTPEQISRAETIFNQNKRAFNTTVDSQMARFGLGEDDIPPSQENIFNDAISRGDFTEVNGVLAEAIAVLQDPVKSYEEYSSPKDKTAYIEHMAFNSPQSLEAEILKATGVADISETDFSDEDLRKEAEKIIKTRLGAIKDWDGLTSEEKRTAIIAAAGRRLRLSETSFDDMIKLKADLPNATVEGLNDFGEEEISNNVERARDDGNKFVLGIEEKITAPAIFGGTSKINLEEVLIDIPSRITTSWEVSNINAVYREFMRGDATPNNDLKRSLNEPLVSVGVEAQELAEGRIYTDINLVFNRRTVESRRGADALRLLPKVDGTKSVDMSYVWITDDNYETELDRALTMTKEELEDSTVGKIVKRYAPEGTTLDPEDKAFVDYISYLKSANIIASKRANIKTVNPLLGIVNEGEIYKGGR